MIKEKQMNNDSDDTIEKIRYGKIISVRGKMDLFPHYYQQKSPQKQELIRANYIIKSQKNLASLFTTALKQKQHLNKKKN